MELRINIPESYTLYFDANNEESVGKEFKKNNALMLFKQGRVSVSKAAELAELDIYEFLAECKKNEIPVVDYSPEELDKEIAAIRSRL